MAPYEDHSGGYPGGGDRSSSPDPGALPASVRRYRRPGLAGTAGFFGATGFFGASGGFFGAIEGRFAAGGGGVLGDVAGGIHGARPANSDATASGGESQAASSVSQVAGGSSPESAVASACAGTSAATAGAGGGGGAGATGATGATGGGGSADFAAVSAGPSAGAPSLASRCHA